MFCWNLIDLHYPDRPDEWRAIHGKDFLQELGQRQKIDKKIKNNGKNSALDALEQEKKKKGHLNRFNNNWIFCLAFLFFFY